jgi:hypothetical protein
MPEGSTRPVPDSTQTPTRTPAPTLAEQAFDANRAAFALSAKYPVRPVAVLTPEQLAATRAQLGPAAFMLPKPANRNDVERRPLTRDELLDARAAAMAP